MAEQHDLTMVFTHEEMGPSGKRLGRWLVVSPEALREGSIVGAQERFYVRHFRAGSLRRAKPGQVFEVKGEGESAIIASTARYIGRWPIQYHIEEWEAIHRANVTAADAAAAQKRGSHDMLAERLEPIRQVYKGLPPKHRDALLAAVISRITRNT